MIFFLLCFIEYLNVFPKRFIYCNTPRMDYRMYTNQIILFYSFDFLNSKPCIFLLFRGTIRVAGSANRSVNAKICISQMDMTISLDLRSPVQPQRKKRKNSKK